ncbi:hypothetical protein JVT61DRAFT_9276 [Boletus reticuloceps]|uniref:Uncharacterized protein n=1 Tax=Boletus reticuloceps TaxID=495285 RepID=A0A8I2YGF9_9AGAM|nr:hypothetical protein JVT61DRAFT_9276 [Boletus reticuloceps]
MSYLVGGGDHYKSHTFVSVNWNRLNEAVQRMEDGELDSEQEESYVSVDADGVHSSDLIIDYLYRPSDLPFSNLSFWEYARRVEKMTVKKENCRLNRNQSNRIRDGQTVVEGRPANPRASFLLAHPQHSTHMVRSRSEPYILSFIGRRIPYRSSESNPSTDEEWCRAMLILFKPWRTFEDLKGDQMSWRVAFDGTVFDEHAHHVMHNMDVESECEDARDRLRVVDLTRDECIPSAEGTTANTSSDDWDSFGTALANMSNDSDLLSDLSEPNTTELDRFSGDSELTDALRNLYRAEILNESAPYLPSGSPTACGTENDAGMNHAVVDADSDPNAPAPETKEG